MSDETKGKYPDKRKPLLSEFPAHSNDEWREAVDKLLKGKPYEKIMLTNTYEGIQLKPMYRKDDIADLPLNDELPGNGHYLRGTKSDGYFTKPWDVAQEISEPTPEKFNKALLNDLNRGLTAVNMVLDEATLMGTDPDESEIGLVGNGGLSLVNLNDLEISLNKVVLDCIDINIQAYGQALPITAMLMALARKQGISTTSIKGVIGLDPLADLVEWGDVEYTLPEIYDEMYNLTKWAVQYSPQLKTIAVHTDAYVNSGGSVVEELAYGFATAVEYIDALLGRGLNIDEIAPRIAFNFSINSNFFMEIAKFRAARVIWSKIIEAYGGDEESRKIYVHASTAIFNKTQYDPYVNMLRTTTEAFSAIVGGIDSLNVGCFDEVIRETNEFSRRIARNQQIILAEECHLNHVIDPAGGSWYIEKITSELVKSVWSNFQIIDEAGGMYKLLESGEVHKTIAKVFAARRANNVKRKDVIIGVNMFANMSEKPIEQREYDFIKIYDERLAQIEKKDIKLAGDLDVETIINAFTNGATLGQVIMALRGESEGMEIEPLEIRRNAEAFEDLRNIMEEYVIEKGRRPVVFLANMGSVSQHKGRADFSRGFFEVAAFDVVDEGGFDDPLLAAQAADKVGADVVVICSSDPTYPELVPPLCDALKKLAKQPVIVLAGYPKDQIEAHKASGVDEFIYLRANALEILASTLIKVGVNNE